MTSVADDLVDAAYHEGGHAVAIGPSAAVSAVSATTAVGALSLGQRRWERHLPIGAPVFAEVALAALAPTLNERYVALMELQVITDLAGSVAETVYRGDQAISIKQRRAMDDDLDVVWAVLDDAWRTTGRHYALAA
jgi:hypothetical protein